MVCEHIFKLLKKDALTKWTKECQIAFDAIKNYLSNPPVLVPPREESPLLLYLSVSDNAYGCVLGQHNEKVKKMDPLKYIFQKAMSIEKLAKWQMLLSELDIVYVTQKAIKLAKNPVNEEEGIGAVLVSEFGQHYPMETKLRFNCTTNMTEYEAYILGLRMIVDMNFYELLAVKNPKIIPYVKHVKKLGKRFRKIEFRPTPRIQNELADALPTIASMIKHTDIDYIDPLDIDLKEHPVHCAHVEVELDCLPWYFDIKKYLKSGDYPEDATSNQKKSIRRMALNFFLSGEVLYRRTPDLGLLRCLDVVKAAKLIEQIHVRVFGTHMNGLTLEIKILRAECF
nr:uncharacterized protein LOC109120300 [Solanum lycopersicum]